MTAVAIDVFLAVLVAACWLAAAGLLRLADPLDRLHCVSFATVVGGAAIVAAGFLADGLSARSVKILVLAASLLLNGAALAHATGRALHARGEPQ